MLQLITSGESHGKECIGILEGMPAGIHITKETIEQTLKYRRSTYGRSKRQQLEKDQCEFIGGILGEYTTGSPICIKIKNIEWNKWKNILNPYSNDNIDKLYSPRPGHADLPGLQKYKFNNIRLVLERANARETVIRTALNDITRLFLDQTTNIKTISHTVQIGSINNNNNNNNTIPTINDIDHINNNPVRAIHNSQQMIEEINNAKINKNTLGGIVEIISYSILPGLGSYQQWNKRIDAQLTHALMSIPSVKGVEVGKAFTIAKQKGSESHDQIYYNDKKHIYRKTNNAGGIEGGITNGEPIIIRLAIKPLSTLMSPLSTININTHKADKAIIQRSDICVVPAIGIIAEGIVSFVLTNCILQKFGQDNKQDIINNILNYCNTIPKNLLHNQHINYLQRFQ